MAILIFISLCEVALLVSLKVIIHTTFSLSLRFFFISHGFELCHLVIIDVDEVLVIFSAFGTRSDATFLTLSVMVTAHRGILEHCHVIVFSLRSLVLVGILIATTIIHTVVLSVLKIN